MQKENRKQKMADFISSPLQQAYSPTVFELASKEWQRLLSEHMRGLHSGEGKVLNWEDPQTAISEAAAWMHPTLSPAAASSELLVSRLSAILQKILCSGQNLHHPHYIGHQVPASVPLAGLFDAVSSITNQVMAIYEMGPWATAVEHALIHALSRKVGWTPGHGSGLLTHGGSLATLTALLTARNVSLPGSWENGVPANAVLVAHQDAHYCVARSAGLLGLGSKQVVKAATTSTGKMDPRALDRTIRQLQIAGRSVIAVASCACTTPTGEFDNLQEIAEICSHHHVWLHVDAAHGGGLLMSRRHRTRLAGIELADSIVWDAHKMLFMPALCAITLYRNADHRFETFQQDAPYLFDPSAPGMADIDGGMRTIECTKRATGFGLWGIWSLFGETIFEELVDRTIDLARHLYDQLLNADDFETLHQPECNIVAFRYTPAFMRNETPEQLDRFQRNIRTRLIRSGSFYIVQTTLGDRAALRCCLMNPMTTEDDLKELLNAIRVTAASGI